MIGIWAGLHAAWLLARGRGDGVARLAPPPQQAAAMAARSFWALPLCLPAFLCLHLIGWTQAGPGAQPGLDFVRDLLGFGVGWLGFAVVMHRLAERLGRAAHWPLFITVWNWCNLLQFLMLVAAALPALLGLPAAVGETAWLVALGWALWLEWFATRLTLAVPGMVAAAVVVLDVSIGVLLSVLSA
jgi:hypothetical protein